VFVCLSVCLFACLLVCLLACLPTMKSRIFMDHPRTRYQAARPKSDRFFVENMFAP
jgi:hypothetical protein